MLSGFGQALIDRTEERVRKEMQNETARLMGYLAQSGRSDDILKAASDPGYLEILFKEYQNTNEYKATLQNEQRELEPQAN